jgi:hypothetical protein
VKPGATFLSKNHKKLKDLARPTWTPRPLSAPNPFVAIAFFKS